MTSVEYGSDWIRCTGHAGDVIVCDSVTILMHVLELTAKDTVKRPEIPLFYIRTDERERLEFVKDGMRILSVNFPNNIRIISSEH